jgi:hypothetical protein
VWAALFRSDRDAVVSQSLAWRDAVLADGRYEDVSLLFGFPSGRRIALPLVRPRRMPAWAATAASWPAAWGIGGPIGLGDSVTQADATAVLAAVARRRGLVAEIRLRPGVVGPWLKGRGPFQVGQGPLQSHELDLAGGFTAVWRDRFRATARTAVRKAERSGLEVEVDRTGRLLPEFFGLYEMSIERWAAMQHEPAWLTRWRTIRSSPPAMLASVARCFGTGCAVWVARSAGEPLAAIIVLSAGDSAKYWKGAMNKRLANPVRANDLLHRMVIEEACQHGYRRYDFGLTRPGSPLAAFKEKLGAVPRATYSLRLERLPIAGPRDASRDLVKKVIGFRDV